MSLATLSEIARETPPSATGATLVSIVTPAFNEALNLPLLYERICAVAGTLGIDWEWIVADDHSSDRTFEVLRDLGRRDARVRALRFSRNFGSHAGVSCGLHNARGNCAVVLAADLQDPPEVIGQLLEAWRDGAQIVWAVRERREGESAATIGSASLFYWIMRNVVGMRDLAATGADFFLLDRRVIDACQDFDERNVNLFALLTWMGFRQASISYVKEARLHGKSGWTFSKKVKMAVDSITSFSYLPVRVMSWLGMLLALCGFLYALLIVYLALTGERVEGWSSLMVAIMVIGGTQMLMLGILGEYIWRTLDEARRRPRYTIEAVTPHGDDAAAREHRAAP